MKYVFLFLCLCFVFLKVNAQGDISDEKKALIRNEHTYDILLNSNGWGLGYSYGKMKNIHRKTMYTIEWVSIKDQKEKKFTSNPDYGRFVFGKQNDFLNFRFGYGNLITLYDKKDKGGIEIRWFYQLGPVLGVLKPVYYVVGPEPFKTVKFDDVKKIGIYPEGGASYFRGFDELSVLPGLYAKIGGSFEFSKNDLIINALECGITFDCYPKKVEIMANNQNKFYFLAIFISYRFGRIYNPHAKKETALNSK
ncbi:MAG: hypothetical protein WCX31_08715 [Salinivirgaceae bacterium]|jgi:hypothetical protein